MIVYNNRRLFKLKTPLRASLNFLIGAIIFSLTSFIVFVSAAPPISPYAPGETLSPACSPGDANCTVYAPLATTLTATTTLTLGDYALNFDSGTFYIDSLNNRVGIGTTSPEYALDVVGDIRLSGGLVSAGQTIGGNFSVTGNTTLGNAATSDVVYVNSRIADSLVPVADNSLDIGDGTNWLRWRSGYFGTSVGIAGTATSTGSQLTASGAYLIDSAGALSLNTTNNQNIIIGGGNVGIGTAAPLQKLDIEKGHIRLGQVAAPTAPTVATGAAGVLTGNYYYRISFVTALGETESGTVSALVAPSAQKVELTNIPVSSDSAVTSRKIYRTTAGGSSILMKLVATIADNTTTTYSDNIADGSLGVSNPIVNSTGGLIYNGTVRAGIIDNGTTAIGMNALRVNTGFYNTAIGYSTLYNNTTGTRNSALGYQALYSNTTGYQNSAIGYYALFSNTTGYQNSAMGNYTLYSNTTGDNNSAIGYAALYSNTTGYANSAMGYNALLNLAGAYHNNTAIGYQAGRYQADGTTALTTPSQSVYIGSGAMGYNNSDVNSIVIGYLAKGIGANSVVLGNDSITTTALKGNVGIGTTSPLQKLDIEKGHIRLGQVAAPAAPTVATGDAGVLTGNYYYRVSFVTALGETESGAVSALVAPAAQKVELTNIPVSSDSAVTSRKIYRTTAGGSNLLMQLVATIADNTTTVYSDNIADGSLGVSNPTVNSTGGLIYNGTVRAGIIDNETTAIGMNALRANTGYNNSAMGMNALYSNTTGYNNSAMGMNALYSNTTGYNNSAMGYQALYSNTTGYYNSAMGRDALYSNTTGSYNSAMGRDALRTNTSGSYNSAMGRDALRSNTTGNSNSAVGNAALYFNTTGNYNSAVGNAALYNLAGAYHNNIAIGYNAGKYQADGTTALTTPSQSVYIGSGAMGYNNSDVNSIVIGYLAKGIGANSVVLGNDSITTTALKGNVGIGTTSPAYLLSMENANGGYYDATTHQWTNGSVRAIKQDIEQITEEEKQDLLVVLNNLNINKYRFISDVEKYGNGAIWQYGIIADESPDLLTGHNHDGVQSGSAIQFLLATAQAMNAKINDLSSSLNLISTSSAPNKLTAVSDDNGSIANNRYNFPGQYAAILEKFALNENGDLYIEKIKAGSVETGVLIISNPDSDGEVAEEFAVRDSIGSGVIATGTAEVFIASALTGTTSKIFITPTTMISGALSVTEKEKCRGFKVEISEPAEFAIYFDWWIVRTEEIKADECEGSDAAQEAIINIINDQGTGDSGTMVNDNQTNESGEAEIIKTEEEQPAEEEVAVAAEEQAGEEQEADNSELTAGDGEQAANNSEAADVEQQADN